ncbi:SpoIIE family protein phosphatase [Streptomyces coeruleorubidus]|uniref:SpoIIE family protein phosphatase n=1 Tax=Streptomyces coeruleorubidus TaxID=116188 RepID=UPI003158A862
MGRGTADPGRLLGGERAHPGTPRSVDRRGRGGADRGSGRAPALVGPSVPGRRTPAQDQTNSGRFVTCFYAHLDLALHQATLASAGHPPPLLRRPVSFVFRGDTDIYSETPLPGMDPARRSLARRPVVRGEGRRFRRSCPAFEPGARLHNRCRLHGSWACHLREDRYGP